MIKNATAVANQESLKSTMTDHENIVTVFGGTGFLGQRIVSRLLDKAVDVRAASRHPHKISGGASGKWPFQQIEADILDPSSIAAAVVGSRAVVNAVSLYVERGEQTFERVHVKAATDLATASRDAGAERFVQISGIGSDPQSRSNYIRARGRGEEVVKAAFPGAIIVRPAVMAGPGDTFITTIARLVRLLPIYPLFGDGRTRLQPVHVEDVAEAVTRLAAGQNATSASIFECAGPRIVSGVPDAPGLAAGNLQSNLDELTNFPLRSESSRYRFAKRERHMLALSISVDKNLRALDRFEMFLSEPEALRSKKHRQPVFSRARESPD